MKDTIVVTLSESWPKRRGRRLFSIWVIEFGVLQQDLYIAWTLLSYSLHTLILVDVMKEVSIS